MLVGLLAGQIWSLLTGLGAVAAGGYALARRPAADFAVALAGACLALFAGVANAAVLARAVAPVPWSPAAGARGDRGGHRRRAPDSPLAGVDGCAPATSAASTTGTRPRPATARRRRGAAAAVAGSAEGADGGGSAGDEAAG